MDSVIYTRKNMSYILKVKKMGFQQKCFVFLLLAILNSSEKDQKRMAFQEEYKKLDILFGIHLQMNMKTLNNIKKNETYTMNIRENIYWILDKNTKWGIQKIFLYIWMLSLI